MKARTVTCRLPAVCINCGAKTVEYRHGSRCPQCEFLLYLGFKR